MSSLLRTGKFLVIFSWFARFSFTSLAFLSYKRVLCSKNAEMVSLMIPRSWLGSIMRSSPFTSTSQQWQCSCCSPAAKNSHQFVSVWAGDLSSARPWTTWPTAKKTSTGSVCGSHSSCFAFSLSLCVPSNLIQFSGALDFFSQDTCSKSSSSGKYTSIPNSKLNRTSKCSSAPSSCSTVSWSSFMLT